MSSDMGLILNGYENVVIWNVVWLRNCLIILFICWRKDCTVQLNKCSNVRCNLSSLASTLRSDTNWPDILHKIRGFHGGKALYVDILGLYAVQYCKY